MKRLILLAGLGVIVAVAIYGLSRQQPASVSQYPAQTQNRSVSPYPLPTLMATVTPTPMPTKVPIQAEPTTQRGIPQGNLTCAYQIPATPDHFGTAALDLSWSGTPVSLCVSSGGGQRVMSTYTKSSGTTSTTAPFLALSTTYTFSLVQGSNGCGSTVLSSCQVTTQTLPTPRPTMSR